MILAILKNYGSPLAGVDEAGRGPLAGPVVAAVCILSDEKIINEVNDSKKISEKKREKLFYQIKEEALSYGIGIVDEKEIDEINILNATKKAMNIALNNCDISPKIILSDAVKFDTNGIALEAIIKGDSQSLSIAAASILAKVTRDKIMEEYAIKYPEYLFEKHKGYPTKKHIELIREYGVLDIHRKSFKPVRELLDNIL